MLLKHLLSLRCVKIVFHHLGFVTKELGSQLAGQKRIIGWDFQSQLALEKKSGVGGGRSRGREDGLGGKGPGRFTMREQPQGHK
jgi:hypothetical protein